jgi:hypothetical protein
MPDVWICPGCGRRYVPACPACPHCSMRRPDPQATSAGPGGNGPSPGPARGTGFLPAVGDATDCTGVLASPDPVGALAKLLWAGVAAVVILGVGWLAGWYQAQQPVQATVAGLNALQRQVLAQGDLVPPATTSHTTAPSLAAVTPAGLGPLTWIRVDGTLLPIPAGWQVHDTTTDYNPIPVDATDAITVQHLQEQAIAGGGFVAWGVGVIGEYWQAERPLGNGSNAVVVAVP